MFARLTITALASIFLAAAAFAVTPHQPETAVFMPVNSTTIEKNSAWPVRGNITMQPCRITVCGQA